MADLPAPGHDFSRRGAGRSNRSDSSTGDILAVHPRGTMASDIQAAIRAEIDRQLNGVFTRLEEQIALSERVTRNPLDNRTRAPR